MIKCKNNEFENGQKMKLFMNIFVERLGRHLILVYVSGNSTTLLPDLWLLDFFCVF